MELKNNLLKNERTMENTETNEIWKQVIGFPRYEVSNLGRVRSYTSSKNQGKILKQGTAHGGYKCVTLMSGTQRGGGQRITKRVHRLVAEAFLPNPNNYDQIDHINTIVDDNVVTNIQWCDAKMNANNPITLERRRVEAIPKIIEKTSKSVLVYNLDYELLSAFTSTADAARKLNLSQGNISSCCMGSLPSYKKLIFTFKPIYSKEDHEKILKRGETKKRKRLDQVNKACQKMYHKDIEKGRERARQYYWNNVEERRAREREYYQKRKYGKKEDSPQ